MIKPFYTFSEEPGRIEYGQLIFDHMRTKVFPGYPSEEDYKIARGQGFKFCNLIWMTPGFTPMIIDHLDLNRYLYSK